MESVEEICDHIALINNAKTILEGPINKIKADFESETYLVAIDSDNLKTSDDFEIISKENNLFKIKINQTSNMNRTIDYINKNHKIISFNKDSAKIEDIFIKSVNNE